MVSPNIIIKENKWYIDHFIQCICGEERKPMIFIQKEKIILVLNQDKYIQKGRNKLHAYLMKENKKFKRKQRDFLIQGNKNYNQNRKDYII